MGEPQKQESFWRRPTYAWIAAVLVAFCCIFVDGYVLSSIRTSSSLFEGLGVQLLLLTLALLATSPRYFALFYFGAAFCAIGKEFLLKDLRDRWLSTAAILAAAFIVAGLTKFIMQLPFLMTVKKLSDAR